MVFSSSDIDPTLPSVELQLPSGVCTKPACRYQLNARIIAAFGGNVVVLADRDRTLRLYAFRADPVMVGSVGQFRQKLIEMLSNLPTRHQCVAVNGYSAIGESRLLTAYR
jgi:hypothetical protein